MAVDVRKTRLPDGGRYADGCARNPMPVPGTFPESARKWVSGFEVDQKEVVG